MVNRTNFQEPAPAGPYRNGNGAPVPPSPETPPVEEISLREVLEILLKGKWLILASFLAVLGAVAIYTFTRAPEYEASSVVYINSQQSTPQLGDLLGLEISNRDVSNEIEILKSRASATRVVEALMKEAVASPETQYTVLEQKDDGEEPLTMNDVVQRLREDYISVKPVSRDVDLIEITATSTVPEEAERIANLYAETYREYNQASSRSRMTASREFLDDVTGRFSEQLQTAENDLTAFLNQERIVEPDEEARQLLEQVTNLQQLQYQTQLQLGMAQAELRGLEEQVERITPGLARQISSGDDLIIDKLKDEIARLQVEQQRLYATNPELRRGGAKPDQLIRIEQQISALTQQLDDRVESLVANAITSGIVGSPNPGAGSASGVAGRLQPLQEYRTEVTQKNIEVSGLQARLDIVNEELEKYKQQLAEIPSKAIVLKRLERDQQAQEQLYLTLLEKMQEARIAEQSELGYVEIIDHAFAPRKPVRPRVPLSLLLGALLGLGLGVGLAFTRNALDNKVRKPEDLRKRGHSVLGVIPSMQRVIKSDFDGRETVTVDGHAYSTSLISLLNPLSPVAEGYRRLRTNIQFNRPDAIVQTVLVTSPGPGEGKSVTSMNLAVTMAQSGRKTLFLDADLRRSAGHRLLHVSREPGLVDVLFEPLPPDMERFRTPVDDLYLLPTGRSVPNPSEVLGSRKMRELLAHLRKQFDVIIVDTPPVLAVTDALLLASSCDATVLVCSANQTDWQALDRAEEALRDVGTRVAGVLLNRFDMKAAYGSYSYGYGYSYYDYYGEKPHSATPAPVTAKARR